MKTIELDLTGVKTLNELHERIRVAFDFPEWYGKIGTLSMTCYVQIVMRIKW